jgi:ser/thr/tyr protein kinase RAD53
MLTLWGSLIAQDFIRQLLDVNPQTRMSLTDALHHPWLSPSAPSGSGGGGGAGHEFAVPQHGLDRNLSDLSELSALPEGDEHGEVNGDASMLSAAPSTDVMLGVHSLQINSSQRVLPPLERRSKVLARELEAEADAQASATAQAAAGSSSPSGGSKRPRSETDNAGSSSPAVDVAMTTGGESGGDSDGGAAAMDVVDPQPRAAKRGRRNQDRQSGSPPTAVGGNGKDNGSGAQGRVLRSRAAAAPQAAGGRR